jgi:hypothetical protein
MGLIADAGYVNGNIVASSNAVVFCYVLYLLGKFNYKVQPITLQKIIKKWIFMSSITYFYTGSTESEVEKQFADLRSVNTAGEFVKYWNKLFPQDLQTITSILHCRQIYECGGNISCMVGYIAP